jgi:hypothetical protein
MWVPESGFFIGKDSVMKTALMIYKTLLQSLIVIFYLMLACVNNASFADDNTIIQKDEPILERMRQEEENRWKKTKLELEKLEQPYQKLLEIPQDILL